MRKSTGFATGVAGIIAKYAARNWLSFAPWILRITLNIGGNIVEICVPTASFSSTQDGKPVNPGKFWAKYIGGYAAYPEPKDVRMLTYPDHLEVRELGLSVSYNELQKVQTMTEERLKASRIFLVGIFAFAWKKRTPYLVITFTDEAGIEQNPVFDVAAISAIQPFLYQQMVKARPSEPLTPQPVLRPASKEDPMEKLAKLKNMVNAGLITEEDYNTKKAEILAKM